MILILSLLLSDSASYAAQGFLVLVAVVFVAWVVLSRLLGVLARRKLRRQGRLVSGSHALKLLSDGGYGLVWDKNPYIPGKRYLYWIVPVDELHDTVETGRGLEVVALVGHNLRTYLVEPSDVRAVLAQNDADYITHTFAERVTRNH